MKRVRRDENGKVIDSLWTRFKSWCMARDIKSGKIARGRTAPVPSRSETQRAFLLTHETKIVTLYNRGARDKDLADRFKVELGNMQAFIRYLQNIERLAK